MSGLFKPSSIVTMVFSIGSLVAILKSWQPLDLGIIVEEFLKAYKFIQYRILDWWFPYFIAAISTLLPWKIKLFPDWRDLTTLLVLYLGSHVREAFSKKKVPNRWLAFSWRFASALFGILFAIGVGSQLYSYDRWHSNRNCNLPIGIFGSVCIRQLEKEDECVLGYLLW